MKKIRTKIISLIVLTLLVTSIGASQSLSLPHSVYGEVQDFDGRSVQNMNVSFWTDNTSLQAWDLTDENGFYNLQLSGLNSGEDVYMFVNSSNTTNYVNFSIGASQSLDHAGEYLPDQNQNNNNGGNNNPSSGGSSGGSGGGGDAGGGGGGGYFPSPDDEKEDVEPKQVAVRLSSPDSKLIDIGEVKEDQSVEISVTGESSITGFNFQASEAGEDVKVNITELQNRPKSVSNPSGSVYSYYHVGIENLDSYGATELGYSVPVTWPQSVNSSVDRVFLKYFDNGWSKIGGASRTETVGNYIFNSETAVLGYFASGATAKEQETAENSDIQLRDFQVSSEGTQKVNVDLSLVAENLGESSGARTISLYSDGSLVDEREVSLESGASKKLSFELTLEEPGSHTLEVGSFSRQVEVSEPSGNIFIIAAGVFVLLLIVGLVSLIYIRETKRANELEQKIRDFESRGRFGRNRKQQGQNPQQGRQRSQDEKNR